MERYKDILHLAHHRSKQRIRDLGEFFNPEKYLQQMLGMLDTSIWVDTKTVFFESTCSHGSFVLAVMERWINSFLKKQKRKKIKNFKFLILINFLNNIEA